MSQASEEHGPRGYFTVGGKTNIIKTTQTSAITTLNRTSVLSLKGNGISVPSLITTTELSGNRPIVNENSQVKLLSTLQKTLSLTWSNLIGHWFTSRPFSPQSQYLSLSQAWVWKLYRVGKQIFPRLGLSASMTTSALHLATSDCLVLKASVGFVSLLQPSRPSSSLLYWTLKFPFLSIIMETLGISCLVELVSWVTLLYAPSAGW